MPNERRFAGLVLLSAVLAIGPFACRAAATRAPSRASGPGDVSSPFPTAASEPPKAGEPPKWDVQDPPGERKAVAIDVREGTWLNLDVSPDGGTIVFDLLGDLYVLPIAGGEARALTSGVAWDMQPTYSPDGQWIAFTSDRGGGDNVWLLPAAGGEPKPVTKETFRLLNSPAWSPDGEFIVARKHFTHTRSLGAGELWLYHRSGGSGLQLTEKQNEQKDLGEPAFSPDGRYVYYSRDSTPGTVFEYNKDPHAGIYAIERLDREEGQIDTVLAGPGGAVRPTPSPDGKRLAYVRRHGLRTALYLLDLASGAEWGLHFDLDRDMQETWAIHGVYPRIAWTPDSKSIVYWAGGTLHRIDAETKAVTDIPFHVQGERSVAPTLHFDTREPDRFHTRMLRWVSVAPDGEAVVFQALGHLWLRELPDGAARRLTQDDDVFEFYPSWSRDGSAVVYTTWSDTRLGTVRIVPRRGGRPRTITSTPGHYVEPAFSPDGETVVYRKIEAGELFSPLHATDPGLYALASKGGDPVLVHRGGHGPHFGADPRRVFFTIHERKDKQSIVQLRSIELTGAKERTHVESARATEIRVAPNGRALAFREGFQVHVAPFTASARPYTLGPKADNVPVRRVSHDAGEFLHWSGASDRLYWSLGPTLFQRALAEAYADPPPPDDPGIDIGFDVDADAPRGKLALVGARIVTMHGDEVIERGTIVIDGRRIAAVGPSESVPVPADARRVELEGTTIVPGLVDVHAHGAQGHEGLTPQQSWLHAATLAFGVTTVHDPSNDTGEIFAAAELARAGLVTAPRIFSTGTILYGAESPWKAEIEGLDDARAHLRRMQAVGAFSVKSYNQPRRDQRQQVIAAARELGLLVVPEGGSLLQHNLTMIVDGHTGIEHAIPVARAYDDVVQLWSATTVGYTPTLGVAYGGLFGETYWYAHTEVWEHERLRTFVPPFALEARARRRVLAGAGDWNHQRAAETAKRLHDAGVSIQLGAHGQREGLAAHWELWMLVEGGLTPHEALRAGTLAGARYLGLDGEIGSIAVGKLADLAIVDGDPLQDIRASERVRYTVRGGRLFDARTLDAVFPEARPRAPFYWEGPGGDTRPAGITITAGHHGTPCE